MDNLHALRVLLSELETRGYSRDLIYTLIKEVDFEFLDGIDFSSREGVAKLIERLNQLESVHEVTLDSEDEMSYAVTIRNGAAKSFARLDTAFVQGGTLGRLYDSYQSFKEFDSGAFALMRKDRELGTVDSVPGLLELVDGLVQGGVRGLNMQRYKGLGEMNPDQLWESTMNPETRTLLQVKIDDAITAEETFVTLMGEEVEPRKQFIQAYAKQVKNLDI
jgi:DNA gyrase subunit B